METADAKQRLVQQLARLDKLEADVKASQKQNATDARKRIGEIDARVEKLAPTVEKWMAANFTPNTPALRAVAEEYCALIGERYDCLLAEGLATEGEGGEDEVPPEEPEQDTDLSKARRVAGSRIVNGKIVPSAEALTKARVKEHKRRLPSGKVIIIKEHEDKRNDFTPEEKEQARLEVNRLGDEWNWHWYGKPKSAARTAAWERLQAAQDKWRKCTACRERSSYD